MYVALLGRISDKSEYLKKDTGELVHMLSVASGKHMLTFRVADHAHLLPDFQVVVIGQLMVFGKELSVKEAVVRHASEMDLAFFDGIVLDPPKLAGEVKGKAA